MRLQAAVARRNAAAADRSFMLVALRSTDWVCPLGMYMPKIAVMAPTDFYGCAYTCPAGTYGGTTDLADQSCSGSCTPGHTCPAGTGVPAPCPNGTFLPPSVAGTASESCIPCFPGTFNNQTALAASGCAVCAAGSYSIGLGGTECTPCPVGGCAPAPNPDRSNRPARTCARAIGPPVSTRHLHAQFNAARPAQVL